MYITPYVEARKSHDPTRRKLSDSNASNAMMKMLDNVKIEI